MAVEVAWCRQHTERAEREYAVMVDGLLAENEQLGELARLLARHLAEPGQEAGPSSDWPARLAGRVEELLARSATELRKQREETASLQKELREERLEVQSLRKRLEDALRKLGKAQEAREGQEVPAQDERARLQDRRRCEHAEARCALVEARCQDTVRRLEAEVQQLRKGRPEVPDGAARPSPPASHRSTAESPLHSPKGSVAAALRDEVRALQAQLESERAMHRQHLELYRRYLPDLAAVSGQPLPEGFLGEAADRAEDDAAFPSASLVAGGSADSTRSGSDVGLAAPPLARALHAPPSGPGTPNASDDEDYAWEGYLEQAVSGSSFEKVFLELSRDQLRVCRARGATEPLSAYSVAALTGSVEIAASSSRCFEVKTPTAGVHTFRCVSERRAAQWVEAVNRAWRRSTNGQVPLRPMPGVTPQPWAAKQVSHSASQQSSPTAASAPMTPMAGPPRTPPVVHRG